GAPGPSRIVDPPCLHCLTLGSFGHFRGTVLGSFGRFSKSGAGPRLGAGLRTPPGSRTAGFKAPPTTQSSTGATHFISVAFRWVRSAAFEGPLRSFDRPRRTDLGSFARFSNGVASPAGAPQPIGPRPRRAASLGGLLK